MSPRRALVAALSIGLLAAPAAALAQSSPERSGSLPKPTQKKKTVYSSKFLWATVNVCDTAASPDTIGIRGSMPGAADGREQMWMRFQVEYFSAADGAWHAVRTGADSGFVKVGPARFESRQAGRSFRLTPKGDTVLVRGVVTFEWRKNGETVRRARKRTTAKRKATAGSDPAGYSASNCTITK